MKTYLMDAVVYTDIWISLNTRHPNKQLRTINSVNRWLSVYCGIEATDEMPGQFTFNIRDEKKFIWAKLRYS